ncbi:MAG TPA: peptidase E [Candidatus Binataceae bacterium]|nr:peptidase E [Candidatus Binataceae bacterium]
MAERHIVAMGGGGFSMEPENPLLDDFVLDLARRTRRIRNRKPRIAFVGTASGDSDSYARTFIEAFPPARAEAMLLRFFERTVTDLRAFVLAQDVIYVGGGSTANLLAIWRVHGLDRALRAAWNAGVVLAGISAGAVCWFQDGITDSFGGGYRALGGGLGFLRGGCCPHYDGEAARRPALHRLAKRGFPPTLALDDGAAAHFVGTRLKEVVSSRPHARAFRVTASGGRVVETPLKVRYLGTSRRPR